MNDLEVKTSAKFFHGLCVVMVILGVFALLSCGLLDGTIHTNSTENTDSTDGTINESVFGNIDESFVDDWTSSKVKGLEDKRISKFEFLDENTGFAINSKNLYFTSDGGKYWSRIAIKFVRENEIAALHFTSKKHGWCVVKPITDEDDKNTEFTVYRTVDGGESWESSLVQKSAVYHDSVFQQGLGWVTGTLLPNSNFQQVKPLVLRFDQKTNKWLNVASAFSRMTFDEGQAVGSLLSFERISIDHEGCALLVNKSEEVYRNCEGHFELDYVDRLGDISPLSSWGPRQLGVTNDNSIWSLLSTGGVNGWASILTILSKTPSKKVLRFSLPDCYMDFGFVLSEGDLFLAGRCNQVSLGDSKKGVVLHSIDQGKTWRKIYEMNDDISYIQFVPPDAATIWILGKDRKPEKLTRTTASVLRGGT